MGVAQISEWVKEEETRKFDQIMEKIRKLLQTGGLSPGDRLLSERELSEKLEVSRSSIREALKVLEIYGVIEVRLGGRYIKSPDSESIVRPLAYSLILKNNAITELLETRKIIEIQSGKIAAVRRTAEDIIVLKDILSDMYTATKTNDLALKVESDYNFHCHIVNTCRNQVLSRVMSTISDLYREALTISRKKLGHFSGMEEGIYEQHYKIYEAIRNGEPETAEIRITEHIESLELELYQIEKGEQVIPPKSNTRK